MAKCESLSRPQYFSQVMDTGVLITWKGGRETGREGGRERGREEGREKGKEG